MNTTRRELLGSAAAAGALVMAGTGGAFAQSSRFLGGAMGLAGAAVPPMPRAAGAEPAAPAAPGAPRPQRDPLEVIDFAYGLGARGIELSPRDEDLPRIKSRLDTLNMFAGMQARLPRTPDGDFSGLEQSCRQAQYLGANAMRAAQGDRRYEAFKTREDYTAWVNNADAVVEKAAAIADRYKVAIAVENHKDRTVEQHVALLKKISSEYVGALVDFGNSLSLCELPEETLLGLAPFVKSCHVKDMGVEPYADGFLLSEVPMGTGIINLRRFVNVLRQRNPNLRLMQETITRDPLKVPIKTDLYWATFPERRATHQARMEAWVEANKSRTPLRVLSTMTAEQRGETAREDARIGFRWIRSNIT